MNNKALLSADKQAELASYVFGENFFTVAENPADYKRIRRGRRSPHYFNIRKGISSGIVRHKLAWFMIALADNRAKAEYPETPDMRSAYDHIAGTPEAMTSIVTTMADKRGISLLQPRANLNKSRGNSLPILGSYNPSESVAAFDDAVSAGESIVTTVNTFKNCGLIVRDYFVLLDREEGGAEQAYSETCIEVTSAVGVSSLVNILRSENHISQTQFDNVAEYIAQYGEPHAKAALGVQL